MQHDDNTPGGDQPVTTGFADLGLRPELLHALDELGYEEPTPIQRETIPHLLAGRDLLGQAATGTGKTAAFALPALELVHGRAAGKPVALVLVPTRELAMQVSEAFFRYGKEIGARTVPGFVVVRKVKGTPRTSAYSGSNMPSGVGS